jgi:Xaa-Pro dipeptidase
MVTTEELPYGAIVALNENGATLHYQMQERRRQADGALHSFLIDCGTQCNGYASDITRSYSFADKGFQALIDGMESAQQQLCADARAGKDFRDLHLAAHSAVATLLAEFGLVTCPAQTALERGITRTFLPHGLGHLLGLQVHDVGGTQAGPEGGNIERPEGHPFLRLTRTLEPGMVLTIEPGLYFIGPLLADLQQRPEGKDVDWARVDQFRRFGGIRIEDNVCVTEGEPENLTRAAFAAVG